MPSEQEPALELSAPNNCFEVLRKDCYGALNFSKT